MNRDANRTWWVVLRKDGTYQGGHMSASPKLYNSYGVANRWSNTASGDKIVAVKIVKVEE